MKHFIHSGDLGDVIYALPTVRAMGGGVLHLLDAPGMTAHGMTPERIAAIRPLLASQPYIAEVWTDEPTIPAFDGRVLTIRADMIHMGGPEIVNLNEFRVSGQDFISTFLPDTTLKTFGLSTTERDRAWLTDPFSLRYAAVIISRSARYHNPSFPWRKVLDKYRGFIGFIGTAAEHAAFNAEFGSDVPHVHTPTLKWAMHVIAGADLFIGNQSCPLAIAHGLKQNVVVEVCPYCPNCIDPRPDCWPGFDGNVHLPDLECLDAIRQRSPAPQVPFRSEAETVCGGV